MSKARSKALQQEIDRLAAEIRLEHVKLEKAGNRRLRFIRKHLKKAAKAMKKSAGKRVSAPTGKKKVKAPAAKKSRLSRPKPEGSPKAKPQGDTQG